MAPLTSDLVWGGLFAVGAAYEAYTLRNKADGDTLSERTRSWFRVHTKPGRAVFTVWYLLHILNQTM